jgi:hypothetical protein
MGQAKRRGTYEDRKREGEIKAKIKAEEDYARYVAIRDSRPLKSSAELATMLALGAALTHYPGHRR